MSRSPLSPAGKRLRTMQDNNDSEDSDDSDIIIEQYIERRNFLMDKNDEDDNENSISEDEDSLTSGSLDLSSSESHAYRPPLDIDDDVDSFGIDRDFMDYDSDDDDIDHCLPEEYLKHDPTPENRYPRPDWFTVNGLHQRKLGNLSAKRKQTNICWFEKQVSNSLWMIQRLELSKRLEEHTGSVNSLDFNSVGNLLCSGSDDLTVCIWDWHLNKLKKKINTGHTNNVNYSKFCSSDSHIITTSRDGSVRLINIETGQTEQLVSQSGDIGKLAFITPCALVTCGTNACVSSIDLRTRGSKRLFIVRTPKNNLSCALNTIDTHPLDNHKIVVAGESPYVFLYDLRRVARDPVDMEQKPTCCLNNFEEDSDNIVTSTAFNSTGDKLLISYNDDDLFVSRTDTFETIHRYTGHRNMKTAIKNCCWFGDKFVMSGSDDGHIYGWDLESEHIVCFLEGDVKGIVDYLCVHPTLPILASSGLDHNVKVWEPISKTWPQTLKGIKPQICKNTMRRKLAQEKARKNRAEESDESDVDLR